MGHTQKYCNTEVTLENVKQASNILHHTQIIIISQSLVSLVSDISYTDKSSHFLFDLSREAMQQTIVHLFYTTTQTLTLWD